MRNRDLRRSNILTWNIRGGRPEDWPAIVEFNRRLALESEDKVLDVTVLTSGVKRLLADPGLGRYFLAEEDGHIVAQTMITYEWSDWRNGMFWWLQSVYVDKDYRGRGVFASLYRHIETLARCDGNICGIRLYVEERNKPAHAVYAAMGLNTAGYFILEKQL